MNTVIEVVKSLLKYVKWAIKPFVDRTLIRANNLKAFIFGNVFFSVDSFRQVLIGANSTIGYGCVIHVKSLGRTTFLKVGKNTYIGEHNNIRAAGADIIIGDNCLISQGVTLVSSNHGIKKGELILTQPWSTKGRGIEIGDDVWLGANVVVLPGVKIGKGVVVGAGAIVTKDIPDYSIVHGNPAAIYSERV